MFLLTFLFGTIIGSFLNVCIYRIPRKIPFGADRSKCPHCHQVLLPLDLIPVVSYIILCGRCRHCKETISMRYPTIEIVTGFSFLIMMMRYGCTYEFVALAFLSTILIVVFMIDLDHKIIPNGVVLTALIGGIGLQYVVFEMGYNVYYGETPYDGLIGVAVMLMVTGSIYVATFVIYKGKAGIGLGDVKLYIPLSLFLGWELSLLSFWIATVSGGVYAVYLMKFRKASGKMEMAFGPFIVIGSFIALIYGKEIINFYLSV